MDASRSWKRPSSLGLVVLSTALAMSIAGCDRSVPPNVTPPGETAAFSEPRPAVTAAPETETSK